VAKAWKILYKQYKDIIINTFCNVELSLNPDSSEDSQLKIQDLPNITVGEWELLVEDTIIVDGQALLISTINLDFRAL